MAQLRSYWSGRVTRRAFEGKPPRTIRSGPPATLPSSEICCSQALLLIAWCRGPACRLWPIPPLECRHPRVMDLVMQIACLARRAPQLTKTWSNPEHGCMCFAFSMQRRNRSAALECAQNAQGQPEISGVAPYGSRVGALPLAHTEHVAPL